MGAETAFANAEPLREFRAYPPRLMSETEAAHYLSIGTTTLRERGPSPKRLGRRVLYDIKDLDRWADRLGDQPLDEQSAKEEAAEVERKFLERRARRGSD